MAVDAIRVQMHSIYALPVARAALPSKRIALAGTRVERRASIQNLVVEVGMALRRRYEPDRAVCLSSQESKYHPKEA
jgi:hypothetical protein